MQLQVCTHSLVFLQLDICGGDSDHRGEDKTVACSEDEDVIPPFAQELLNDGMDFLKVMIVFDDFLHNTYKLTSQIEGMMIHFR